MDSKINVFVLSLKKSQRLKILKKRLKDIKINYKILFGINGNQKKNHKKLEEL
jgi:hypothetical protein